MIDRFCDGRAQDQIYVDENDGPRQSPLSVRPIRMIALMGIVLLVVFIAISVWVFATWMDGHTIQGWTSVMLLFLLILVPDLCHCGDR